ncbi:hypothetical protein QFC21_006416 [Naganishia friedmannii]|uniref:Uncharacterized protein n=1 Tax=Naganishia friedmannii TaxID=89922 RepID=A0ACC2V3Z7_9TREE|nr:hypothetical protein QFC21_006416 [Naganishia friedmannii]
MVAETVARGADRRALSTEAAPQSSDETADGESITTLQPPRSVATRVSMEGGGASRFTDESIEEEEEEEARARNKRAAAHLLQLAGTIHTLGSTMDTEQGALFISTDM